MNCVNWLVRLTINDVRGRDEGVNVNVVHSCSLVTVLLIILPGQFENVTFFVLTFMDTSKVNTM